MCVCVCVCVCVYNMDAYLQPLFSYRLHTIIFSLKKILKNQNIKNMYQKNFGLQMRISLVCVVGDYTCISLGVAVYVIISVCVCVCVHARARVYVCRLYLRIVVCGCICDCKCVC